MAMKILLLNPPFLERFSRSSRSPAISKGGTLYYPLWLAYATGVLEKEGLDVRLIDGPARGYNREDVVREAERFRPELTVLDTSTPSIKNDMEVAGAIKEATGSFTTLVGTHVSALPEEALRHPAVDSVARREYDYTLRDLAHAMEEGRGLEEIQGLSYRHGGRIVHNPERPFIEDLDEIPFVSAVYKGHLRVEDYFYAANLHPVITILSGRGCPYRCVYCLLPQTMNGRRYRLRSPANFVAELEYIRREFPQVREVFIEDDTLTANRARCREISDMILERGLKVTWSANSRADVDLETMRKMRAAGCRLFCVGFESGTQEVLDTIHKGTEIGQIRQFMRDVKEAGILVHGCFMLGCPGETRETIERTIDFALELAPDTAQFFPIMVYPGTEAYQWARENRYLTTEDYSQWLTEEGVHNCLISRPGLSNEELVALCDEARRRFYLRPEYILATLRKALTSPREAKRVLKSSRTFFRYLLRSKKGKAA